MGTTRLPDRIPIKGAIKLQERVYAFGGLSALVAVGGFVGDEPVFGIAAGAVSGLLFWGGSCIKTHRVRVLDGGVYR